MSIINFSLSSASKYAKAGLNQKKRDPTTMNDDQRLRWEAVKEKRRVTARKNYRKNHPEPAQLPPIISPGKTNRAKEVEAGPSISSKRRAGPSTHHTNADDVASDLHTRQKSPLIVANWFRSGPFSTIINNNKNLFIPSPRRSARISEESSSEAQQAKATGVEAQPAEEMDINDELRREDLRKVKVDIVAEKRAEPQCSVKREDQEYLVLVEDPTPTGCIDEGDSDEELGHVKGTPDAITRNGTSAYSRCGALPSNTDNDDPSTLRQCHRVKELEVEVGRLKEELAKLQKVVEVAAISLENGLAVVPGAKAVNNGDLGMEGDVALGRQEDRDGIFIDVGVQTTPQDQLEAEIELVQLQGQYAETTVPCVSCEEAQVEIRKLNSELVSERRNLIESEKLATSCNEDLNDFLLNASPQTQSRLDFLGRLAMHCSGLRVYEGRIKTEHSADTRGLLRVISRIQEDLDEEVMKEDEGERKMRNLSSVRLTSKNATPLANPKMPSDISKNANGKRTRGDGYIHDDEPCESGGSHNTLYRRVETSGPLILKKLRFE